MQRRNFLRLVGGGTVVAVGAGLGGCSSAVPPEALVAWQGPPADLELRRWVLSHALLAPHSHNLQSWIVELRGADEMLLHCDRERLLPQTDPLSRQIMMSHGTFLELLAIAAAERGRRAEITLFPEGAFGAAGPDDRPVAHVRLLADAGQARDPLFAQILRRHTHRGAYDAAPVPAAAWQAMAAAAAAPGLHFGHVDATAGEAMARHRQIAAEAWRIELTTPRTILESFQVLRVVAAEVARHRDGLTLMDPMVVLLDKLGLFDRTVAPAADSFATRGQIEDFEASLAATPAFLWLTSDGNERVTQVDSGRAYARVQLAATAHGVVMQPLSQALQEYEEQRATYAAIHALVGAAQPAQTVQMWARVGPAAPTTPSPRRPLDAILRP